MTDNSWKLRYSFTVLCCLIAMMGCTKQTNSASVGSTDSVAAEIIADTLQVHTDSVLVSDPSCQFDSAAFRSKLGIGLVTLNFSGYPFPAFRSPEGTGDTTWISLAPRSFYQVAISDSMLGEVDWFFVPTEYDGGAVAWRDSSVDGAIGIGWNETSPTLWLMPDTSRSGRSKFFAHRWKECLGRTVWLHPTQQPDNPLRTTPSDAAKTVPYPTDGYPLYSITSVKHPWVHGESFTGEKRCLWQG